MEVVMSVNNIKANETNSDNNGSGNIARIRSAFFAKKPKSVVVNIGTKQAPVDILVTQIPAGSVLDLVEFDDMKTKTAHLLVGSCVDPQTFKPVFDLADVEAILARPYSEDFKRILDAANELSNFDVQVAQEGKD